MSVEVVVPNLGLGSRPAFLTEWYCPDGATVSCGELVYRLESDFVSIDIEAEAEGVLRHRIAAGGIASGEVVALILAPGERLPRETVTPLLDEVRDEEPAWEEAEERPAPPPPFELDEAAGPLSAAISLADELIGPERHNGHHPGGDEPREPVLFLRRNTLPEPPTAPAGSDWDAVPGDRTDVVDGWVAGDEDEDPASERPEDAAADGGHEPDIADSAEKPAARDGHTLLFGFGDGGQEDHDWRRFEVQPFEEPASPADEAPRDEAGDAFFEQDDEEDAEEDRITPFHVRGDVVEPWDDQGSYPVDERAEPDVAFDVDELLAYPPPVLTFRTRVDVAEAQKLCAQLTREWRVSGATPQLEDVALRAIARALGECRGPLAACDAVGLVTVSREGERLAVVEAAASRPFRDAVLALADDAGDAPAAACAVTLLPLAAFGLDEGTPPLPAGHALAFAMGSVCDAPAPAVSLTLSYDPEAIAVGEAAWFLGRVRELVEAPYALLAD